MSRFILPPSPWTQLPQQPTQVRSDLPKPTALFLAGVGLVDPVNGTNFSLAGSAAFGAWHTGKAVAIPASATTNHYVQIGANPDLVFPDVSNGTIVIYRRKRDTTNRAVGHFGYSASNTDRVSCHLPYSDNKLYFDWGNTTTGRLSITGLTFTTQPDCFILLASATRGREVWRNGKLVGSNSNTDARPSNTSTAVRVGSTAAGTATDSEEHYLTVVFPNDLTQDQCMRISAQPWFIFQPQPKPFYFNALSSGTTDGVAAGIAVGTGAGVGASLFSAPGAGIAVATGAAVGASLFSAPSSGIAVATGATVGASLFEGVAAGTAVATGAAVGEGSAGTTDGAAAGTAVATGAAVGASLFSAPAAGTAVGTGLVVGASLFSAAAAGTAVATGIVIAPSAPAVNRTQGSERYAPNPIPRDLESLIRYLDTEFNVIKGFINRLADGHIDMTYVEPVRPRTGDYRLADGTEWNPGSGYGMYVYDGSTWQRLVDVTLAATETQAGIIEIATQAEANTGTDDARAITPLKLKTIITEQTWDG